MGEADVKYYEPVTMEGISMGKIGKDEVKESVQWWENSVVFKVLGGNPPFRFMEGFFRRKWGSRMDKMWMLQQGTFMVRFKTKAQKDLVIEQGTILFDNKPVLVKGWDHSFDFDEPTSFPVWVQLPNLNAIYWTPAIISKIVSPVGIPIKLDRATMSKERLQYARVLLQMKVTDSVPKEVAFIDENDVVRHQELVFEWKPVKCARCQMMGHSFTECKRKETKPAQKNSGGPMQGQQNGGKPKEEGWQTRPFNRMQKPIIAQRNRGVYVATGKQVQTEVQPQFQVPQKDLDLKFQKVMKKIGPVSILRRNEKQN